VQEQDGALAHTLGARRADVVLLQDLQHGRAGDAGDQRDVDRAERDGRQDQVLEPGQKPRLKGVEPCTGSQSSSSAKM
jgi:hypothetical protein